MENDEGRKEESTEKWKVWVSFQALGVTAKRGLKEGRRDLNRLQKRDK